VRRERNRATQWRRQFNDVHTGVRDQAAAMWAHLEKTGRPMKPEEAPLVAALCDSAVREWRLRKPGSSAQGFVFLGRRYACEVTSLSRIKVLDWRTRKLLVCGGPGVVS
jgi:hypothetical protein